MREAGESCSRVDRLLGSWPLGNPVNMADIKLTVFGSTSTDLAAYVLRDDPAHQNSSLYHDRLPNLPCPTLGFSSRYAVEVRARARNRRPAHPAALPSRRRESRRVRSPHPEKRPQRSPMTTGALMVTRLRSISTLLPIPPPGIPCVRQARRGFSPRITDLLTAR